MRADCLKALHQDADPTTKIIAIMQVKSWIVWTKTHVLSTVIIAICLGQSTVLLLTTTISSMAWTKTHVLHGASLGSVHAMQTKRGKLHRP